MQPLSHFGAWPFIKQLINEQLLTILCFLSLHSSSYSAVGAEWATSLSMMVRCVLMWMSVWTVQTSVHTTVTTLGAHLSALVVTVIFWNLMATVAKSQVYTLRARANMFLVVKRCVRLCIMQNIVVCYILSSKKIKVFRISKITFVTLQVKG